METSPKERKGYKIAPHSIFDVPKYYNTGNQVRNGFVMRKRMVGVHIRIHTYRAQERSEDTNGGEGRYRRRENIVAFNRHHHHRRTREAGRY